MPTTPLHHFSARTRLILAFAVVVALLVGLGTVISWSSDQKDRDARRVERAQTTITLTNEAYLALVNMQTGYRGYLLTGESAYLEPLAAGEASFFSSLDALQAATGMSVDQRERWREIRARQASWRRDIVEPALALRDEVNAGRATLADVETFATAQGGNPLFDSIRALCDEVLAEENARLDLLAANVRQTDAMLRRNLVIGTVAATLLTLAIGAGLALDTNRTVGRLSRSLQALPTVFPGDAIAAQADSAGGSVPPRSSPVRANDVERMTSAIDALATNLITTTSSLGTALDEARRDQAWMRAVLDGITEGIFTFDMLGYIQTFSRQAEIIFGRSAAATVECHVNDLLATPDGTDLGWLGDEARLGERRDMLARRPNGPMVPIEIAVGLVSRDRSPLYIVACRDISDLKRAQREMDLLEQVRHVFAREVDLHEVVRHVVDAISTAVEYRNVRVYLREGQDLHLARAVEDQTGPDLIEVGDGPIGQSVVTGTTVLVSSPPTGTRRPDPALVAGTTGVPVAQDLAGIFSADGNDPVGDEGDIATESPEADEVQGDRDPRDPGANPGVPDVTVVLSDRPDPGQGHWAGPSSLPDAPAGLPSSLVAVPLHDEDRVIGVLVVERPGWNALDSSDVSLIESLGAHLEIAMGRARLYTEVRESETRFAAFMGNSPTLAWMKDEDLRYVYVNDRFAKLILQTQAHAVGRDDFALWPAETAALLQANDRTVLRTNRPLETHEELPTFGDPKTFLTFRFPFHDSDGRRFVGGVAVDVSEHREAEVELERQYREADHARSETNAILDATSEAMLLVSPDGHVITVNRRFGELLGMDPSTAIGRDVASLQPTFDRIFFDGPEIRELLSRVHADGDPRAKHVFTQQWPEHRELELYATTVRDVGGDILGRLTVFRDVTRERAVDRMKTDFVALVSHELRTPLTSIKGYVDLLLDGDVGELEGQQRDFLEVVSNNVERQVALINDLLDISTMESGKIVLNQTAVDLTHAIQSVSWAMANQIERKGQRLMLDVPADIPDAWGDRARITQILTNLISNAHKYTPKGGLIQIAAARQDELVRVDVRDSGIGMTPDEQAHLFNKFFRAKNRTTEEAGGTGLGLVITRALVDMQGGSIEVVSAPGKGSVFSFTLPLVTADGVPSISPEDAATAMSRRLTMGTGRLAATGPR
ncbi:MAG: PAS domain-containing protein [Thermomicrobiales bacterium]